MNKQFSLAMNQLMDATGIIISMEVNYRLQFAG